MAAPKTYSYPKKLPLLNFFLKAEAIRKNPIPFHRRFFETYGDTFSVKIGRKKHLMLSRDKEVVQHILQKNHKNYYKSSIQTNYLSKYLGNGLLTSNGDFWLKQRRLIQPAFHKDKMVQLIDRMEHNIASQLANLDSTVEIPVFPVMNELAFKVVAKSLFHLSVDEEKLSRLQRIIEKVQVFLVKEVRLPHKGWWFRLSGQVKKHRELAAESQQIIRSIIEERKNSGEEHSDLLDMLLDTRYEDSGEPMSTQQLIDEISILFVAGHETTANALTFTSHLLARHPEVQEKVLEEIREVEKNSHSSLERIQQLKYTRAVIDEAMRLYPPAWITDRENLEDDQMGEYYIRKDTLVGVSFYELHRHPEYWEKPDLFWPERFLGDHKKKTAGIYYPFGAGPRMCIGMGFAVYEMVLAVSYLIKHYQLTTGMKDVKVNPLITLKPLGVSVEFSRRPA
ncbi:cytochrome P450 [Poritiphilus flavus]|uniref:Cytochrome P450 n=1 Tax=Poritiphilus flavus TaxID=2697053 RepID=A0A6L9EGH6_9FLAO|nr:cytochrome P450 [Poritiphilus flavus]NAS13773.1 cytochrome P450 [Poritiphilus flavus]